MYPPRRAIVSIVPYLQPDPAGSTQWGPTFCGFLDANMANSTVTTNHSRGTLVEFAELALSVCEWEWAHTGAHWWADLRDMLRGKGMN